MLTWVLPGASDRELGILVSKSPFPRALLQGLSVLTKTVVTTNPLTDRKKGVSASNAGKQPGQDSNTGGLDSKPTLSTVSYQFILPERAVWGRGGCESHRGLAGWGTAQVTL